MADAFSSFTTGLDSPCPDAVAVNLASDTTFTQPTRALYVGGAGDVKVDMLNGETGITFKAVPVGTLLPIRVSKVYSTANGTTATNLVGLY